MLGLHAWHAQYSPKQQIANISEKGWAILFILLHLVTHSGKCYHVVLVSYGPAYPKFSEITNHQYLWKGMSDFVDFLHAIVCIFSLSNSNYFTAAKKCQHESCIKDFTSAKMEFMSAISKIFYFSQCSIERCCKQITFIQKLVWPYK